MTNAIYFLAVIVPMGIYLLAMILRFAADAQAETPWSQPKRTLLFALSYLLIGVGFVSVLFTFFITGILGGGMLFVLFLGAAQMLDVELKIGGKRRLAQQAETLWLLATTVRRGGSLADDLEALAHGAWGLRHRRLMEMATRIRQGTPLSEIIVPQGLLSRSATLEIQGGLQSGHLYEALRSAARRQTREMVEDTLSANAQATLMYPTVILTTCTLVVGFVMYYIIPKFKKIFDDFGTELPEMTIMLINASDAFVNYWYLLTPVLYVPLSLAIAIGFAEFHGWRVVSRVTLGYWFSRPHAADLLRYLSQAVAAGRTLPQALDGLKSGNVPWLLQCRANDMRSAIMRGEPAWQQLERQRFLSASEVVLVESAEDVRNLSWTLNAIADAIERRWRYRVSALMKLMGPAIVVILGIGVGFIAVALFLPLVKLVNDLS